MNARNGKLLAVWLIAAGPPRGERGGASPLVPGKAYAAKVLEGKRGKKGAKSEATS
jgi:hypothetical protein